MPNDENISEKYAKHLEEMERMVSIQGDHIVINVSYKYEIPISDCGTHEEVLGWVHHLCEKTWITPEVLERFIEVACRAGRLELPT